MSHNVGDIRDGDEDVKEEDKDDDVDEEDDDDDDDDWHLEQSWQTIKILIIMTIDHQNHYHHDNYEDHLAAFQAMLAECVEARQHFWRDESPIAHLLILVIW